MKSDEKTNFEGFRQSMEVVLTTADVDERKANYAAALDEYREFQLKYPNSVHLAEADKLFKQYEEKFKE